MEDQAVQRVPIPQALQMALEHHQAGRLEDAELIYRAILDSDPSHPGARYNLGLVALQAGRMDEALPVLREALDANPGQSSHWLNYAVALAGSGDPAAAKDVLLRARQSGIGGAPLEDLLKKVEAMAAARALRSPVPRTDGEGIAPSDEQTLSRLLAQRRHAELENLAEQLTVRLPHAGRGWLWLGAARLELGNYESARAALARALELRPQDPGVMNLLGLAYRRLGRNEDARRTFEQCLALAPNAYEALLNASANAITLRDAAEARRYAERAFALRPDALEALRVMADAAVAGRNYDEAVELYRRGIVRDPQSADLHVNLGDALARSGQLESAVRELEHALALQPDDAKAHLALGNAHYALGEIGPAIEHYRRASDLAPKMAEAHTAYLFALLHDASIAPADSFAEHVRIGDLIEAPYRDKWPAHDNDRDPDRDLRVGFVSGDLRDHAIAYLIEPVWRALRKGRHMVFAYANQVVEDEVSARLRALTDRWVRTERMTDEQLCAQIRDDRIDILFDLSGHTVDNRLLAFARKPAPVQVTWLGYPGTTGLTAMDYRFVRGSDPSTKSVELMFREKVVRFGLRASMPEANLPDVEPLPALSRKHLTFGSFNRVSKINESVVALWSRVLQALPGSRLLIGAMAADARAEARLKEMFAMHGVTRDRLDFRPRAPMLQYLAMHNEVDIALDTFPYSGGTTTHHALWMGVPVLTLSGQTLQQNHATTALRMIGLEDWVADTPESFVANALRVASDLPALAALRQGLRERMQRQLQESDELFARELDTALRLMWQRWCAGLPPAPIEV